MKEKKADNQEIYAVDEVQLSDVLIDEEGAAETYHAYQALRFELSNGARVVVYSLKSLGDAEEIADDLHAFLGG